jgi:hypothetical protein
MNNSLNYQIKGHQIIINSTNIDFDYGIKNVIQFGEVLIILLKKPIEKIFNENVFGVNLKSKKIIWQIAPQKYNGENCPFVQIDIIDNQLRLFNWCGVFLDVDPISGEVLEIGDSK